MRRLSRVPVWVALLLAVDAFVHVGRPPCRRPGVNLRAEETPETTTTTPVEVYIEATDSFNVVFYANYFKYFQWGLRDAGSKGWLSTVDVMRFKEAAVLGDSLEVLTTPMEDGRFEQSIVRKDGSLLISAQTGVEEVSLDMDETPKLLIVHQVRFDDIDLRGSFSLDATLRGFERARSLIIGGPDALASLLSDGVAVVVTRVDKLRYRSLPISEDDDVRFLTTPTLRGGRFLVFDHDLLINDIPAARASVTCVCLDANTSKPITIPDVLKLRFHQLAADVATNSMDIF